MKFKLFFAFLFLFTCALISQELNKDVRDAMKLINEKELKSHILFLSDDLLEGRKTGSYGNSVAARYIASQFEAIGLLPGCDNGKSYFQPFKTIGIRMDPDMKLKATGKNGTEEFKYFTEFIGFSGSLEKEVNIIDAEVVFAGYGIAAPEFDWNDFKDFDVKGKMLLVMNNDPSDDPNLFEGKTRMYYGRWSYKFEKAAEMGAVGAIIIHTNESAAYGWNVIQSSWSGEQFDLKDNKNPKLKLEGWLTDEASKKLTGLGGFDLDDLRKSAEVKNFKPVPLNIKVSVYMKSSEREVEAVNVIGYLKGGDKKLQDEAIVYTSHYDHLGIGHPINGDSIYNGALDNATGVSALLSIARSFAYLKDKPKRSVIFISTAAEEEGLLGSKYYSMNPTIPPKKIAAELNIDAVNIWGVAKNVVLIGGKYSDLFEIIGGVAKKMGMYPVDDQNPAAGNFFRSDQLYFANLGIPSVYFSNGDDFENKPKEWGREQIVKYTDVNYHQPSDEVKDWWNFDGMTKNTQLFFLSGLRIANDPKMPQWKKGTRFDSLRKKSWTK